MLLIIIGLIFSLLFENILALIKKPITQKIFTLLAGIIILTISILFIYKSISIFSLTFIYLTIFRIVNLIRLTDFKKQQDYLKRSFKRTLYFLTIIQAILIAFQYLFINGNRFSSINWIVLISINLIISFVTFREIRKKLIKFRMPSYNSAYLSNEQLPSITVAIPARNEDQDLRDCLESIIKSNYPKLEILVLDDCSQTRKTAEIIKEYAHDGVIFLQGEIPPKYFSAKNFAYQQLLNASNGEIIFFMGVDVRMEELSLRDLVEYFIISKKRMLSVLPSNEINSNGIFRTILIQPMRYFWELGLPRTLLKQPPVLSTFWGIYKKDIDEFGGFRGLKKDILPERTFARNYNKNEGMYEFFINSNGFQLKSVKTLAEQKDTAIRLKYPSLKQRLELLALVIAYKFIIFVLPFIEIIFGLISGNSSLTFFGIILLILSSSIFYFDVTITLRIKRYIVLIFSIPIAIYDIFLDFISMWKYEFGEVIWKDRNVCIPVMSSDQNEKDQLSQIRNFDDKG